MTNDRDERLAKRIEPRRTEGVKLSVAHFGKEIATIIYGHTRGGRGLPERRPLDHLRLSTCHGILPVTHTWDGQEQHNLRL